MNEDIQRKSWPEDKEKRYLLLFEQLSALLDGEMHPLPVLANTAALLWQAVPDINWAGFYLNTGKEELLLGPFQGKAACIRIPFSRGVCGAAAREERTQLVRDVHQFPGHIACDSASNSEIVVPLMHGGQLMGVLDIDSPLVGRFDADDRTGLERIAAMLSRSCRWEDWRL
ncbi:MAG: GAF domain-containing protein [Clostridia bacterium]|nr:GAF domain-containing protein [Clostridia bacterium]